MKRLFALFLTLFLGSVFNLLADNITISGYVLDDNGDPIIGASVVIKGTSTGVHTDENGSYSISAPSNCVLVASYIGYDSQEKAVNGLSVIHFVLSFEHGVDSSGPEPEIE